MRASWSRRGHVIEIVTAVLVLTAALFLMVSALGLLRMPDLYTRLGASTKAVTLGGGLMFVAVAVHFADAASVARAFAGLAFLVTTAPLTAHVIARAAIRLAIDFAPVTITTDAPRGDPTDTQDRASDHR